MPDDPYTLRCEAERLVGEDRVPGEELERLCSEFGGIGPTGLPPRRSWLHRRGPMVLAVALRRIVDRHRPAPPAAHRLDGAEAIALLFDAASDPELPTLDGLVERAGLGWKCRARLAGSPCHQMNVGTARCAGCGAEESEGKEEPDG